MPRVSIKKRIDKMVKNLQIEFENHGVLIQSLYLLDIRHLKIIVDYPLNIRKLIRSVDIPTKCLSDFFEFLEDDIKGSVYIFIRMSAEDYGYY